jgi:hypothetical protein
VLEKKNCFVFSRLVEVAGPDFSGLIFLKKKRVCVILTILEVYSVDCKCHFLSEYCCKNLLNMAKIRLARVEQGQTKIRNVIIAVTPEGFWCCPSPVVFQKTLKTLLTTTQDHCPEETDPSD